MRKQLLLLVSVILIASLPSWAQDYSKAEVFGGYSLADIRSGGENQWFNGFQASAEGNLTSKFGLVGDFGGQFKSESGTDVHFYQYLFGPRLNLRSKRINVFAHFLAGGATLGGDGSSNDNHFAMAAGGGVDAKVNSKVAIRLVQFDWIPVRANGAWHGQNIRLGFGVVLGL